MPSRSEKLRERYATDPDYRQRVLEGQRRSYAKNPERAKVYNLERNRRLQATRLELMAEARAGGCVDCGWKEEPAILQFDHVRGVKRFCLGGAGGRSLGDFKEEMAKCDVRCPTCHTLRHFREDEADAVSGR